MQGFCIAEHPPRMISAAGRHHRKFLCMDHPFVLSLILFCVGLAASCTAAILECLVAQRALAAENAQLKALLYREAPLFPDLQPITRRRATPRPPPFPLPPVPKIPLQSRKTRFMTIAIPLVRKGRAGDR